MIDSGENCYFSSTTIFNNKNIMSTDVFNLNEACIVILLDTELSTMDFILKYLIGIWYAFGTVCIHCGRPWASSICLLTFAILSPIDP